MRQAFGEKVRTLRREKGLNGQQLGKLLRISQAAISKIENGGIKPSVELAKRISGALHLNSDLRDQLVLLAQNYLYDFDRWAFEEGDQYLLYQKCIGEIEQKSLNYNCFVWNVIPGLLQTKEYVTAMHLPVNLAETRLEDVTNARIARQVILKDTSRRFKFVLAEQCLYTCFASANAHIDQLKKISHLVKNTPLNLEIRILPRNSKLTLIPNVNFILCDNSLVLIDGQYQTIKVWYEGQIDAYAILFDDLWAKCASRSAGTRLLRQAIASFS